MLTQTTVDDWKKKPLALCEGYEPEGIFHYGWNNIFFRETTNKSFIPKARTVLVENYPGRGLLALTASMMGGKIKSMVIENTQKPTSNLWFIFKQIKQWKKYAPLWNKHQYSTLRKKPTCEQRPFFFFPWAVFVLKFDCSLWDSSSATAFFIFFVTNRSLHDH